MYVYDRQIMLHKICFDVCEQIAYHLFWSSSWRMGETENGGFEDVASFVSSVASCDANDRMRLWKVLLPPPLLMYRTTEVINRIVLKAIEKGCPGWLIRSWILRCSTSGINIDVSTLLYQAIAACDNRDDGARVSALIECGADVHRSDDAALRICAKKDNLVIMRTLLYEANADLHAREDEALRTSVERGRTDAVSLLLDAGANASVKNSTPLRDASSLGYADIVRLLIQKGAADVHQFKDDALRAAAAEGHVETTKELLDAGADVQAEKNEPLLVACRGTGKKGDYLATVRLLLDRGADVHAQNEKALRVACSNGDERIVQQLLDHGANVSANENTSLYPLHVAALGYGESRLGVIKSLLRHGAKASSMDSSPLCAAVRTGGGTEVLTDLLDAGADVCAAKGTPLRLAAQVRNHDVIRLLLQRGAAYPAHCPPPSLFPRKDGGGGLSKYRGGDESESEWFTGAHLLCMAARTGDVPLVRSLLESDTIDVNAPDDDGEFALCAASKSGNIRVVEMLMDAGADKNASYSYRTRRSQSKSKWYT